MAYYTRHTPYEHFNVPDYIPDPLPSSFAHETAASLDDPDAAHRRALKRERERREWMEERCKAVVFCMIPGWGDEGVDVEMDEGEGEWEMEEGEEDEEEEGEVKMVDWREEMGIKMIRGTAAVAVEKEEEEDEEEVVPEGTLCLVWNGTESWGGEASSCEDVEMEEEEKEEEEEEEEEEEWETIPQRVFVHRGTAKFGCRVNGRVGPFTIHTIFQL
ncbi:hypothetical protein EJ05DRAFT_517260 [Pseudovirgaria hyperparasitica]|uniref:Uncharacterized protein n=1 Tax=Pseudovirgaria hyperparasitica TaxID=470096 RepID=A0A6A6W1Z3_9PEZI|nr:uncharacterized protein EJ05DRAFT_517260 [Pseudovirgaria hyperparasitica]KAF2756902.1 hypothetical protein EJ05DRAFT_517260 [Pseudovirgaria hyperparasitica]